MWGKDHEQNLMSIAVFDKLLYHMTAVAVNNKQPPLSLGFGLSVAIKHLLKPRQSQVVIRLSS